VSGPAGTVLRMVAVLLTPGVRAAAPPGVDRSQFGLALAEDSCDLVAELELVTPAIAVTRGAEHEFGERAVRELSWPGTAVIRLAPAEDAGLGPVAQTLRSLAALGAVQGAVLAADAPDLPPLLIGKLFRALGGAARRADAAICPADGGGLVALAAWLPPADWVTGIAAPAHLRDGQAELDLPDATERLRRLAPRRSALQVAPGWHRLRTPADIGRLDPGLEGWAATRGVLGSG
jgi:hypothetical protein